MYKDTLKQISTKLSFELQSLWQKLLICGILWDYALISPEKTSNHNVRAWKCIHSMEQTAKGTLDLCLIHVKILQIRPAGGHINYQNVSKNCSIVTETHTSLSNSSRSRVGTSFPHNKAMSCCGSYFASNVIVFVFMVESSATELLKDTRKISISLLKEERKRK